MSRRSAREAILDVIRAAEPLSRVEIARTTGLTEASVSMTVRRLLDEGLVVETGRRPTAGKPRTLLKLDPGARLAVGVHLDAGTATFVLTGQTGGIVSRLARPTGAPASADELAAGVTVLLAGSGVDVVRCLGIGLVRPPGSSLLRPPGGSPLRPPGGSPLCPPGGSGDDLGERLAAATGLPVLVENDATAAAVGEYWVARRGPDRAFAALHLGSAIGAGIMVGGRALRGGEFGHFCVRVDGPPCPCGSRGCLEAVAGPGTVVAAAAADPAAAAEAGLGPPGSRAVAADFAAIARAARAGAPACHALLEDSAEHVAAAAESVVNLLDLDLIVLTGTGFAAASFVYGPAILRRLEPADTRTWHRSVTVTVSPAAATASATGAAALVLQSRLRAPT
ncbi:ROK family transcriptional regulator [Actinoplanes sp. DH11]|uniref:ROK family transcriptional regulator n=1 Tax=Actinoplanes sp. DH11 TaxID=2857011 RepID=UPI001E28744F|nr:ROK family transcriptional regulator [Actinoplanes sp. DH11]